MRALSIRQPWASLILAGHKTVENRVWNTTHRGPIIVHAGVTVARHALGLAERRGITDPPIGAYLGVVDLVDIHHADKGCRCDPVFAEMGVHHWQLADPRLFPTPIAGPGRLGLYEPPTDIYVAAHELLDAAFEESAP